MLSSNFLVSSPVRQKGSHKGSHKVVSSCLLGHQGHFKVVNRVITRPSPMVIRVVTRPSPCHPLSCLQSLYSSESSAGPNLGIARLVHYHIIATVPGKDHGMQAAQNVFETAAGIGSQEVFDFINIKGRGTPVKSLMLKQAFP